MQIYPKFVVKSINGNDMVICGYASVYNIVDQQNDIIIKGTFSPVNPEIIKFLWQHDATEPIGIIKSLREDDYGLEIEAVITGSAACGAKAINLIQQGVVDGLSIGFNMQSAYSNNLGQRVITKGQLVEVSIVTFPANKQAKIYNINNANIRSIMNSNFTQQKTQNEDTASINARINFIENQLNHLPHFLERPQAVHSEDLQHKSAFCDYIRKCNVEHLIHKSFSSVQGDGDVLLIPALHNKIISEMNAISPMRQLASIETISTNALDVVIEDGELITGWVGDIDARDETHTPKLLQKRITVHELYAQPKATQSLIDDSAIQIDVWLAQKLCDSFVAAENTAFIAGNGQKQPSGILDPKHKIKTMDIKEELSDTLFLDLISDLNESYMVNATFLMNRATLSEIQKLKDGNDRLIWQHTMSDSLQHTIFGIPVVCSNAMPRVDSGKCAIAFGDFKSAYKIVDRSGINIMRDPYTDKPFIKFYAVKRVGGDVVNPSALRLIKFSKE